ncbi:MAG: hypothetical protein HQL53_15000, partial [Magnetococcales bacterium]|nr:hypothetical protein [Magnetococcales bacterium]
MKRNPLIWIALSILLSACATQPGPEPTEWRGGNTSSGMTRNMIVTFSGFNGDQMMNMEMSMEEFPGFVSMRTSEAMGRRKTMQYKSSANIAKLEHNLRLMLRKHGYRGRITFQGVHFTIETTGGGRT